MRTLYSALFIASTLQVHAQNTVWANSYGGTDMEYGRAICLDNLSNVITAGFFNGTADFDPGAGTFNMTPVGGTDIFVQKVDANGNFLWAIQLGGSGADEALGLECDGFGNILVTGFYSATADFDPGSSVMQLVSNGFTDAFICKLYPNGSLAWAKSIGGVSGDEGFAITTDINQDIIVTGEFQQNVDFDPGVGLYNMFSPNNSDNAYVLRLTASGTFEWAINLGNVNLETGFDVEADYAGNIYVAGRFSDTCDFNPGPAIYNMIADGGEDAFVLKLTPNGNFIRAQQFGGNDGDEAYSVDVNGMGEVVCAGSFRFTCDFDPGVGMYTMTASGFDPDGFVVKTDSAGTFLWARQINGSGYDYCYDVVLDPFGNVYSAGFFSNTVDFDPGSDTANLDANLGYTYVQVLNQNGDYVWAGQLYADLTYYYGEGLEVDFAGNMYMTGCYWSTVDFDLGAGTLNRTSVGQADIFTIKLELESSGTTDHYPFAQLNIYPNPCSDFLQVMLSEDEVMCGYTILDLNGRIVHSENYVTHRSGIIAIPVENIASGRYVLAIATDERNYYSNFIRR